MKKGRKLKRWQVFCLALGVYLLYLAFQITPRLFRTSGDMQTIRKMVASEELILELTPQLKNLARDAMNLQLPGHDGRVLFDDQVHVVDLSDPGEWRVDQEMPSIAATVQQWRVSSSPRDSDRRSLELWRPLMDQVEFFEHAKFYFVDGHFTSDRFDEFESKVGFKGLARMKSGHWGGVTAKQTVRWRAQPAASEGQKASWGIASWSTASMQCVTSKRLLFTEVLDQALPRRNDLLGARRSEHEEYVKRYYQTGAKDLPWKYFSPLSANLKPGISVVDINQDGFDDLYVTVRVGRNQLLLNRRDGTFEEGAARFGLDIEGHSTCAIFADFDNDGDPDLMLGRSLRRSMYLENRRGQFHRRELTFAGEPILPYLVVSMSAADYNKDGLLDVYLCTYRPAVLENIVSDEQNLRFDEADDLNNALDGIATDAKKWPDEFLSASQARQYYQRHAEKAGDDVDSYGQVLDQVGPPNVLLVNLGHGRFGLAPESRQLQSWRNSLQATWADFDDDGDPDLFVANDWATNSLYRNDLHGFVDITESAGATEFGFAMGATWGDYNNDGYQDLYVANMFSKAGRRITARISELNPDYVRSVEGNYLYRQNRGKFQLVSGLEPPALTVAEAGWSWGAQFSDLDNDGFLDLYALSGYFTAPKEFATDIDL